MEHSPSPHPTNTLRGRAVLSVAHVAGMIDMAALPVWVGALISKYQLSPQQAGGLVTLFLASVVLASLVGAPLFRRLPARVMAPLGFALAALAFITLSSTSDYLTMALLHAASGLSVGWALSFTHGTMGRTSNPHRMFAMAGLALGIFAVVFLGFTPKLIEALGGPVLFQVFSGLMLFTAVVTAAAFPAPPAADAVETAASRSATRIPATVWGGIIGIGLMALIQAMMFSFMERLGSSRGFSAEQVQAVLIAVGFVNLLPAVVATWLQNRLPAHRVLLAGPALQAVLALVITQSSGYTLFFAASSVYVFVMIFTHIFAFGMFAAQDPSGRAVAATPAMIMTGSAIAPILGGALVQNLGFEWLGYAITLLAFVAIVAFSRARVTGHAANNSHVVSVPH
jgi:predicted MFS family arabinose efflux permease